jgi:hypothetical protein
MAITTNTKVVVLGGHQWHRTDQRQGSRSSRSVRRRLPQPDQRETGPRRAPAGLAAFFEHVGEFDHLASTAGDRSKTAPPSPSITE